MILNSGYEALIAGLSGCAFAQILKVLIYFLTRKKINFKVLTTTGGMPSSHSAAVISLTTSIGLIDGFDSTIFAVSMVFAIITMYDAAGIRRAAGKTAATLNRFIREHSRKTTSYETLKELLGHTPKEVYCGALLGILVAYAIHSLLLLLLI